MAVIINTDECIGCGSCETACPIGAIAVGDGIAVVDADVCIDCGNCIGECPVEAISE